MAIDKIFKSSNVDDLADNILSEVDDFMVSVDKMQQRKVAGNVQKVIQAFKQIETDLQDRYDNVTDVLEKRVSTIKDGRDGVNGTDGRSGRDGKPGRDGINGKQGTPGTPGKDGTDGVDGVSVTDANIDFDGSLVISLSSGQQINVGEVVPPELERQLVELRQGGGGSGGSGGSGDVTGPASSTDNAIVRFDGTTGKVVQNSVVTIADTTGNMAGVGTLGVGAITTTGALVGTATQNAFNTVSTTLNLGGAATAVNIGAATGTLTVANTTLAAKAITASTTLGVTGVSTLTAGAVIQGMTVGLGSGAVSTNTAVGTSALAINTTGYQNTVNGSNALQYNTTGYENTADGVNTLNSNTIGHSNTAIGVAALILNTTASNNTAIGFNALVFNTTASNSTAVGYQALFASTPPVVTAGAFVIATAYTIVTVGTTNFVAIGASANTVGVVFTATGAGSGTGTASTNVDATNTALGYGAGSAITTGTKNTIIGAYTGNQGGLDIRTASNHIVLSDGDGNPRGYFNASGVLTLSSAVTGTLSATTTGQVGTTLGVGAATPSASGAGITFPATQSASSDANTLDDYEEGTYTVTLTPSTSGTITVDSSYKTGAYTKVGRLVSFSGQITTSAVSSPVGYISLSLPFPIADLTEQAGRGTGSIFVGGSLATTINDFVVYGIEGETAVRIYLATGSQPTADSAQKIDGSTDFVFQYTYFTT